MGLLPEGWKPEPIKMTIKLKRCENPAAKAPVMDGFVAMSTHQIRQLLAEAEASENGVVFARVALWNRSNGDYPITGQVSVNGFDPHRQKETEQTAPTKERSVWF